MDKNPKHLESISCCFAKEYKEMPAFEFLPGHKNILLHIPEQITAMKTATEKTPLLKLKPSACSKKSDKVCSDQEVKSGLTKQLSNFTVKIGFNLPEDSISESNILYFVRGSEQDAYLYKCKFSCPFCDKVIPLQYKTFWTSSNVTTHLKSHMIAAED